MNHAETFIKAKVYILPTRIEPDSISKPHKELVPRMKKNITTQQKEPNKNIILETLREKRLRICNKSKYITQFYLQITYLLVLLAINYHNSIKISHLIEPDNYFIINVLLKELINAVLQKSGKLLEYRQLIKDLI